MRRAACALLLALSLSSCLIGADRGIEPLVGGWRGVILTEGGDLPFGLRVDPEGSEPAAVVINGDVQIPIVTIVRRGAASYTLTFADPEAQIVARMSPDGAELSGYWSYQPDASVAGSEGVLGPVQMPFRGRKNDRRRFPRNDPELEVATPQGIAAVPDVGGRWDATTDTDSGNPWIGSDWLQEQETVVASALGVPGSAPPKMVGIYRNGLLRLSYFDGRRAFMIHARATPDGTLEGSVWINDRAALRWSARRPDDS